MDDLISRQETIGEIYQLLKDLPNKKNSVLFKDGVRDGYARAIGRIRIMPSAQPERKKGEWKRISHNVLQCEHCKKNIPDITTYISMDFCPNCGSYNGGDSDG